MRFVHRYTYDTTCGIISDMNISSPSIVIDTNVIVSAFISSLGASFKLIRLIGTSSFSHHLSVALALEYEERLKALSGQKITVNHSQIDTFMTYVSGTATPCINYFRWPYSVSDVGDRLVFDTAVNSQCDYLITHNLKHFSQIQQFGITALQPGIFLAQIGGFS